MSSVDSGCIPSEPVANRSVDSGPRLSEPTSPMTSVDRVRVLSEPSRPGS